MRAALLTAQKRFEIRRLPVPEITHPHDVLIKMVAVGICGSDIHYYRNGKIGDQVVRYPFSPGHEGAGIVERVGKNVTRVRRGDRIAIDPAVSCGHCDQCLIGRENTCRNLLFLGCPGQLEGCLREFIVLPETCCFPLPETMSFEQAVLSEPLAIALYAVERTMSVQGAQGATAAILGAGPVGISTGAVLRFRNAGRLYVTDAIEERVAFARIFPGPAWCGNIHSVDPVREIMLLEPLLLDAVYECCGRQEALLQAIDLLKPGGVLAIIGIPEIDACSLPLHALRRKEITILNIRRQNKCTQKAIDLLRTGAIRLDSLVTHRFQLERVRQAFDLVADYRDGVMKAVVTFGRPA